MKTIKNYRFIMLAFLAILTFAIGLSVLWTSLASNAFAVDDEAPAQEVGEATTEDANDLAKFSFSFSGLAAGVVPEIEAQDASGEIKYIPGTYLEIDNNSRPNWDYDSVKGKLYFAVSTSSGYTYKFTFYDPFGYTCNKYPEGIKITGTTDFVIDYKGYEGTYTINTSVTRADLNSPVANCELMFYDKNWNLVAKGTTSDDGTYSFKGLDRDHAEGVVMISQDGYESDNAHIDSSKYDTKTHTAEANLTARSDADCALKLKCKDSQHQAFEFSLEVFDASDPTRVVTSWYTKVYSIATNLSEYGGTWTVSPEGVITNKYQQDDAIISWTLKSISNEGFTLDHWTLDRGDGNKIVVLPNESFDINSSDKLWLESFYAQAPEPTPDPDPTPTPTEEVNATAQTGDSTAALPLAILAALSVATFILGRKAYQK